MVERKRHLAKALTYRVFGSAGTAAIAYIATGGDAKIGVTVGIADSIIKVGIYYVHERAWYKVKWGVKAGSPKKD